MMFVVDTNILLYAANRDCPEHSACLEFLERSRNQTGAWYVTWNIVYGFMRVVTHPWVLSRPWPANGACAFIEALLASPGIAILAETDRHATVIREIITEVPDVVGNLLGNLHIAALMREHGIGTIYTRDVDFHRFPFLRVVDPVSGRGS